MEYEHNRPVTKAKRAHRRERERKQFNDRQEKDRRARAGTGKVNAAGVTLGQNAEQGNTTDPHNTAPIGSPGEE
jgi:hypothetical protein